MRALRLPKAPPPLLIFFDRRCTHSFALKPAGRVAAATDMVHLAQDTLVVTSREHRGSIALPDGRAIPAAPETFASLLPEDSATFLVLALSDLWYHDASRGDLEDRENYLSRAFVHEMTHSRQLAAWAPLLRIAGGRMGLTDVDDDIVQHRFDSFPGFRAAVLRETMLLYEAAFANDADRRRLVGEALRSILQRRTVAYGGPDAAWSDIEQLLLDMEGAAQWAALAYVESIRPLSSRRSLIQTVRESRSYWSQDEGLALHLALDALVPNWQREVFAPEPKSSLELLQRALAR